MKKLLLISTTAILASSAILLPTAAVFKSSKVKKETNQIDINSQINLFLNNKNIKTLEKLFLPSEKLSNEYVQHEENIHSNMFSEIKYALNFYPIFKPNSLSPNYSKITLTAKNILSNAISNDWYWYLKNIDKFMYVYTPYGDKYATFPNEEELINKVKEIFPDLSIKLQNNEIQDLFIIDWNSPEEVKPFDKFLNKKHYFLTYNNNYVLHFFAYEFEGKNHFVVDPFLLYVADFTNIEKHHEFLALLANKIEEERKKFIDADVKYWQRADSDYDLTKIYSKYNDEQFATPFNAEAYNNALQKAIDGFNTSEGLKVLRFAWREIYE
ncbi:aromatic motif membrane protein [Mycoplasmopsis felifaucium]|uniref:aromatic motif membrane protein n=1 Tax=Mycoplasmopsis felifaucium TaxID=35768 RepID=UPI000482F81B|nr:aromatic motif membrane protein [Mycoplasmopsis felifaucium]